MSVSIRTDLRFSSRSPDLHAVYFARINERVGVGVRGDRDRALPDGLADIRKRFAVVVPKRNAAVAQLMRAEVAHASRRGRLARLAAG